jgi:lipid-binding SYLF domain-containing protein
MPGFANALLESLTPVGLGGSKMIKLCGSIVVAAGIAAIGLASPAFAVDTDPKLDQKLKDATAVYHELLATPDRGVPEALLKQCRCIAVIPHVLKGAFVFGARFGRGVMSCRNPEGNWSPPSFVSITGGSWGLQIGGESSDLVLFFMSERGARSLMTSSKITLGGKASVAAGPLGRSGEASTDLKLTAEIYTYAKSKGLFAGLSLEGARLAADKKSNARYYGQPVSVQQLLFERRAPRVPEEAEAFRTTLP